jgi:NAD(P)-dependent dehydrogenase (short-subunit alcohol dehydrogenase family)
MSTVTTASLIRCEPELLGQTVVVIGGSAGIGLETVRRARAEGAKLILTGRNPERLHRAGSELDRLGYQKRPACAESTGVTKTRSM